MEYLSVLIEKYNRKSIAEKKQRNKRSEKDGLAIQTLKHEDGKKS